MSKASSLFVLILFAAMVTQVNAQVRPGGHGQGQGQQGGQQGGQQAGGQQGGQQDGTFDPNYGQVGSVQGGYSQGGYGQQGSSQGGYAQGGYGQGGIQGGYGQGGIQGGYTQGGFQGGSYGSPDQVISQRVSQSLRMREVRRISELLRLSMSESMDLEASSLTISAQSLRGPAILEISTRGRLISSQRLQRQLSEVTVLIPSMTSLDELEVSVSDDVIIDTITALVHSSRSQGQGQGPGREMQPMSGQMIRLDVRQDVRYGGEIPLKQLVRQQLGLTLEGAQIERIAVEGQVMRGFSASVQVELNGRLIGPVKSINPSQGVTPIPLNSMEEVRGSLKLVVRGDVVINQVHIRIGQVRPIQGQGGIRQIERIQVSQEISSGRPLELSRLLPYDNRLVSSLTIDARSSRGSSAEVALVSMSQVVGSVIVTQVPMRPMIQLMRPMALRELRLQSLSPVIIDALEIGFDGNQMW